MESIWCKTIHSEKQRTFSLSLPAKCETVVIGAGMAGILTAFLLQQQGMEVLVLEAAQMGSGQTQNTTAKITSQHGLIYHWLIKTYGVKKAGLYAWAHQEAIEKYRQIILSQKIDCDFTRLPSYLYSIQKRSPLEEEAKAAASLGLPVRFTETLPLPFEIKGAVCFENQAQFHPLKFLKALAQNIPICENTKVLSVKKHTIFTPRGNIAAKNIVFAAHYPFINMPGFYFLRQHQERSYVVAFSQTEQLEGMYYSIDPGGLSLRSYKNFLLLGGSSHRTGKNQGLHCYDAIRAAAAQYFPQAQEAACWSAQDCMPHDRLPLIGPYSRFRPYWYTATGFQKWGMTSSMLSAMIISDALCGKENPYAALFSPRRFHPAASAKNLAADIGVSLKGLLTGYHLFSCPTAAQLPNGCGGIIRKGLRRKGCYKDLQGNLYCISLRCPHMGCQLLWNQEELSWDCPCHGSRFDYRGRLIDNPAQCNKKGTLYDKQSL